MTDLSHISTLELAKALAERTDLRTSLVLPDGLVLAELWPLRTQFGPIACTDGVAIRRNTVGELQGGVIRRQTGKCPGKLTLVGGVVGLYEPLEHAMRRHWRADLGLEIEFPLGWDHPVCMRQYAPQRDGVNRPSFSLDPTKHSYASTHLVIIRGQDEMVKLGSTRYGQEAQSFHWFSEDTCPPESEWAYNMRGTFLEVFGAALHDQERVFK